MRQQCCKAVSSECSGLQIILVQCHTVRWCLQRFMEELETSWGFGPCWRSSCRSTMCHLQPRPHDAVLGWDLVTVRVIWLPWTHCHVQESSLQWFDTMSCCEQSSEDSVVINSWVWSATVLAVAFRRCYREPQGVLRKYPRHRGSSDRAAFFQSAVVELWWACSQLTGAPRAVVICFKVCCAFTNSLLLTLIVTWLFELLLPFCQLEAVGPLSLTSGINHAFPPRELLLFVSLFLDAWAEIV